MRWQHLDAVERARWSVAAVFFVNGSGLGSWAPHIALVQDRLGIGAGVLGAALLAMAAGALVAMPLAGAIIARVGSRPVVRAVSLVYCAALPLPMLAPNLPLLVAALLVFGAANGAMDVAMNAHAVTVERRLGRPVMSSFHGMFSLGGLVGAGGGGILLGSFPPAFHIAVATTTLVVLAFAARHHLLPATADLGAPGAALAWPKRATLGLGALTFLAFMGEGAVLDWSAAYLRSELSVGPGFAAAGFAAFSAAMAIGRFTGDWVRRFVGAATLVRWSGLVAAAGLGAGLALGTPAGAVLGFAITGFGLANLAPVLFGAAARTPGQPPSTAIAAVATMGYTGFLAGPPLIGFAAEATSLAVALGLVVVGCTIVGLSASAARSADDIGAQALGDAASGEAEDDRIDWAIAELRTWSPADLADLGLKPGTIERAVRCGRPGIDLPG